MDWPHKAKELTSARADKCRKTTRTSSASRQPKVTKAPSLKPLPAQSKAKSEQPSDSTLTRPNQLYRMLREAGFDVTEWSMFVSGLCPEGMHARKHTSNITNYTDSARLPVRACCFKHSADAHTWCCALFYPPDKQYDGRHQYTIASTRHEPGIDAHQHHAVGQQAQVALIIAALTRCSPRQKARMVNVDICSGTQSQRKGNLRLGGLRTISIDIERVVHCFGATVVNHELDVAIGGSGCTSSSAIFSTASASPCRASRRSRSPRTAR